MRILLANHTGAWSGAEVSLMRVIHGLREGHDLCVACPAGGPLADELDRARIERLPLPEVDASLRLHPLRTPVGLARLGAGGVALARAARCFRADVIHANSTRTGILGAIARGLGGPPFVVRAHEHLPLTPVGRSVRALLVRSAGAIVAVSDHTAGKLDEGLPRPVATRVYNSIDHDRFDPATVRPASLREELALAPDAALLGQVAQITPWKGQDTSVRALAGLRAAGLDAHLVLVGQVVFGGKSVRYDNHAFLRRLERLVDEVELRDAVHFLGQRDDVPAILRALDLSLLPSWEEPFGLVTVESMALATPPLVGAVGAGPELVEDGVSGRVLEPRRPELWSATARGLLEDREALRRMGEAGPARAAGFRDDVHARELLAIYERVAGVPARPREPAASARPEEKVGATWPS
jgi:glycosyltransferase involved in cell wall biosynthesis